MEELLGQIDSLVRADWLNTAVSVVLIIAATAIVARLATRFLRRLLHYNGGKNLPSSSIFVNIARAAVWVLGVCVMLSTCFNVDVSAAITALGIGGIAISLGFQDTISNLIGGLQVSLLRIVKPGDNIEVGTSKGVVKDVSWRHTTIRNAKGEVVIIPNSIINKTALVHLPPTNQVSLPVVVATDGDHLDGLAAAIEQAALAAASSVGKVSKDPKLVFSEILDAGFKGTITFRMADSRDTVRAGDAVLRAIAPLTRPAGAATALADVSNVASAQGAAAGVASAQDAASPAAHTSASRPADDASSMPSEEAKA